MRSTAPGVQWELSKPVRLRTPRPRPRPTSPAVFSPIAAWLVPKEELVGGPAEARGALGPQGPAPCHTAVLFPRRPLDGNTCLSQRHSWAPLQVLHGDTDILFPVSGVGSYSPADAPLGSLENGTGAQDRVRPEPGPRYRSVLSSQVAFGVELSSAVYSF